MRYLYDYGEGLLCFGPVLLIGMIAAALLWNSLPDRTKKRHTRVEKDETSSDE